MESNKLTPNQEKAITSSGKNILVSASAGSGKTFVMIERIIRLILEEGVGVENILAVTFTKLAASEMKQKLVKAVTENINKGKDVARLKRTLAEIPTADISTIHSFCLNLLKTYFYAANVDPNFGIAEDTKINELSSEAMNSTFLELYENNDEEFLKLVRKYRAKRSDSALKGELFKLYDKCQNEAEPKEFLQRCVDLISPDTYDEYEKFIVNSLILKIKAKLEKLPQLEEDLLPYVDYDKTAKGLQTVIDSIKVTVALCERATTLKELLTFIKTASLTDMPRFKCTDESILEIKAELSSLKKSFAKRLKGVETAVPENKAEDLDRYLQTKDDVKAIVKILDLYDQKFKVLKEKEGVLGFSDLEHKTLELLRNNPDVVDAVKEKYKYIFADEYQDVNGVQEEILQLISNDNLFMVGDVKQSIYAFRGCNPDIFAKKYDDYSANPSLGLGLPLDKNFRSSSLVLDAVNNIFSDVITKEHGGVSYKDNPMIFGGLYEPDYGNSTLHILNLEKADKELIEGLYDIVADAKEPNDKDDFYEGALIARIIEEELKNEIYDEKEKCYRKVNFSDIAVLTRTAKGYTDNVVKRLVREGIPVVSESRANILDFPEIKLLTDVLKLINFYADDPPHCAVLKNVAKLSESQLAEIRYLGVKGLFSRDGVSFLSCVERYKKEGDDQEIKDKLLWFEKYFNEIRILSEFMSAGELLAKFMRDTGLDLEIAGKNLGKVRLSRIDRFLAESQPNGTPLSCAEFLEKINNAQSFTNASEVAGSDAVKVLSMHASKGLEYPIVIIPGLKKQFNRLDDRDEILYSRKFGVALYHYDESSKKRYSTLARTFFKQAAAIERANEEARVFYVATTRAKARLHLVATKAVQEERNDENFILTNSFTDFLSLKDMPTVVHDQASLISSEDFSQKEVKLSAGRQTLTDLIYKNLTFTYPHQADTLLPVKSSVTTVNGRHNEKLRGEVKLEPKKTIHLENVEDVDSTAIGTAYHRFLETCDLTDKNVNNQLISLLSSGKLTKEQADLLDENMLEKILSLPVWELLNGYKLYKEQPFITSFTARELYGDDSDGEILVQGIIDLLAVKDGKVIIVDYKTSDHSAERLKKDYEMQLSLYKKAVEKCLKLKVEKTFILSLKTGELINL